MFSLVFVFVWCNLLFEYSAGRVFDCGSFGFWSQCLQVKFLLFFVSSVEDGGGGGEGGGGGSFLMYFV